MAVFDVSICMDKPTVRIDDWAVVPNPASGKYQALRPGALLVGRAFGHPKMKDGTFIFTSAVVQVDTDSNTVQTRNTCYTLGKVSQEYQAWRREHSEAA